MARGTARILFTRLIPSAQFYLMIDAAHLPCIEAPESMAERLLQFLQEVQVV